MVGSVIAFNVWCITWHEGATGQRHHDKHVPDAHMYALVSVCDCALCFFGITLHHSTRRHAEALTHTNSLSKKGLWMAVTAVCVLFALVVSWSVPYFAIVMAVIAALGDIMSMFGLPCLFSLKLLKLSRVESVVCWVLLVLSVGLSGVGVYSSIQQLIEQAYAGGGGM